MDIVNRKVCSGVDSSIHLAYSTKHKLQHHAPRRAVSQICILGALSLLMLFRIWQGP